MRKKHARLWQQAASFAARFHRHQTRKDGLTPYIAHPFRVAMTVRDIFGVARCEKDADGDLDLTLLCLWIALNGLYGVWDEQRREPQPDRESWRRFLDRLLAIDASNHVSMMLRTKRELVKSISHG